MKLLTWLGWTAAILLCIQVGVDALRYLEPGFAGPEFILQNRMAKPWLVIHAGSAAAALMIGPAQFLPLIRARLPRLHRWLGRFYILACVVGGLTGLLLAWGTMAGPVASAGFALLALLLLLCAVQAWRLAVARKFDAHREWAIRSYALVFAGVTLRLWLPLSQLAHFDFMESYRVIAFLAWAPNLLLVELYLVLTRYRRRTTRLA